MYCPMCGEELRLVEHGNEEPFPPLFPTWNDPEEVKTFEKDNLRFEKEYEKWVDRDQSDWYACDNCNKFGDDFPLQHHHPLKGYRSQPGDSWSLSWIK